MDVSINKIVVFEGEEIPRIIHEQSFYTLKSYLTTQVYANKPKNIPDLKDNIRTAIREVEKLVLFPVYNKMVSWERIFIPKAKSERIQLSNELSDAETTSKIIQKDEKTRHEDRKARGSGQSLQHRSRRKKWDKTIQTLYVKKKFNVLMVADQIKNDEYDKRFVDACIVLCREGHNVTILSTKIMKAQCFEIRHYCRKIYEVGKWIPRDLCGAARSFCFFIRSAYLALWAYFYLQPSPDLIFCNCINISAMKLFRWIKNCRLLTFFQVFNYNQIPRAAPEYNIQPKLSFQQDVSFLDEVLCSNLLTKYVFKYTYKAQDVPTTVLYPTVRKPLVVSIDYSPPILIPANAYTFLAFYNFVPTSRFELTIQAFGIMYSSLEDSIRNKCYLLLIGHYHKTRMNDNYIQILRNQILCMDMQDRIFILNNVQHCSLRHLMGICHAYIHAQSHAVCEDNIIEAMAAGKPVIAANSGFPCEVIKHKETGYLLPQDADVFADAMIDLLVHPERYKMMCCYIQNVYEENFSYSYFTKCVNRIVSKYDQRHYVPKNLYKMSQDVIDLNNALEEIHRYYTNLPTINVLATHQELITDRFYHVEKFYADIPALPEESTPRSTQNLATFFYP